MTATAKIDLNITEGMIANAIACAIADAFSPEKKDQVLRDIVRAHLSLKTNSWDRDTMLSKAIGDAIRQQATEAVKDAVASMAPDVKRIVAEVFGPKARADILRQLETSLNALVISNISLTARAITEEKDDE